MITNAWQGEGIESGSEWSILMHRRGDYSGEVHFNLPAEALIVMPEGGSPGGEGRIGVAIPFEALKDLVASYVSMRKIEALEQVEDNDRILGL